MVAVADVHPAEGGVTASPASPGGPTDTAGAVVAPVPVAPRSADTVVPVMSAPMSFNVRAKALGKEVNLVSEGISDLAGIACTEEGGKGTSGDVLNVLRFAHYGRSDSPFIMNWVLFIPPGAGTMSAVKNPGKAGSGYRVTLKGDLRFTTLLKGATVPIRLTARTLTPEFVGISRSWPPHDVTLSLSNGPIPFFADSAHAPLLTVLDANFILGRNATKYFAESPRIIRAEPVGGKKGGPGGGVRLEWQGTGSIVKPIEISGYNIYRSPTPGNSASWRKIGTVAAGVTSFTDNEYDGRKRVAYAVTHRAEYSAGYQYEGVIERPYIMEPK